jgi:hypothetical protein
MSLEREEVLIKSPEALMNIFRVCTLGAINGSRENKKINGMHQFCHLPTYKNNEFKASCFHL